MFLIDPLKIRNWENPYGVPPHMASVHFWQFLQIPLIFVRFLGSAGGFLRALREILNFEQQYPEILPSWSAPSFLENPRNPHEIRAIPEKIPGIPRNSLVGLSKALCLERATQNFRDIAWNFQDFVGISRNFGN